MRYILLNLKCISRFYEDIMPDTAIYFIVIVLIIN
jgi:hypothetical protein